jgi:sugar phosphate isomerase/epimerase
VFLSLSGFLFEDRYTSQSVTFPAFCEIARSAGYDGAELRGTQIDPKSSASERRAVLRIAQDHGLPVTCLTARGLPASGPERDDFFRGYLDLCRDLECGLLKIGSDTAWLRDAAEQAKGFGVTLATNNHVGGVLETVAGTRGYLAEIAHSDFGLLYDALHLSVTGEDYVGCIPEFVGTTRNVLIHSAREARPGEKASLEKNGRRWASPCLPDAPGVQDWPAVFRAFKRSGYDGLITVIESGWPIDRREGVARHCAGVVRRLWGEA